MMKRNDVIKEADMLNVLRKLDLCKDGQWAIDKHWKVFCEKFSPT